MKPVLQQHQLTKVDGIIMMIVKKGNAKTKAELAERLHFEPASLTRSLKRLVERQLILRFEDPNDKRFIRLELTDAGQKITQTLEKHMLSIWKNAFDDASEKEIKTFIKLLKNARQNLINRPK